MKNYEGYSDEELIRLLRQGETEVTEYILNKYRPLVHGKIKSMFLMGGDAEDLFQEGMVGLFKAVKDYRDDRDSSFFHFAEICIQRQLYKAVESSTRKKHSPLNNYLSMSTEEGEASVEQLFCDERVNPEYQVMIREEIQQRLNLVLDNLSKLEKEVFFMHLQGYDYVQIAKRMKRTPKSIDNALQRIRQKVCAVNGGQ